MNTNAMFKIGYGLYVLTAKENGFDNGCIINTVSQVTVSPNRITVAVNKANKTHDMITATGEFNVSILSTSATFDIFKAFGFRSGKDFDKFSAVEYSVKDFMPVVNDACGYIVCQVINKMETTTHTVFLGEVVGAELLGERDAMTYAYYHKVIKGKSPKNAPTYIPETEEKSEAKTRKWKCQVCGYVYEGEELPEDYKCPVCGMGVDKFVEITD